METYPGELPPGLPAEPPLYPDADIVVSSRQPIAGQADPTQPQTDTPEPEAVLYLLVLETRDEREQVFDYYQEALDEDPWQIELAASGARLDTFRFSLIDDADITGAVQIARGDDDRRTTLLISLEDAGASVEEPPFELPESLRLPPQFPQEVPLYDGATITNAAFVRQPGDETFIVSFLTRDAQDEVLDFYRKEFEGLGWTVQDGGELAGLGQRIDFRDGEGDIEGEVAADRFARDREFTEVRIVLSADPSRPPPGDDEPAEATPTASDDEPAAPE